MKTPAAMAAFATTSISMNMINYHEEPQETSWRAFSMGQASEVGICEATLRCPIGLGGLGVQRTGPDPDRTDCHVQPSLSAPSPGCLAGECGGNRPFHLLLAYPHLTLPTVLPCPVTYPSRRCGRHGGMHVTYDVEAYEKASSHDKNVGKSRTTRLDSR